MELKVDMLAMPKKSLYVFLTSLLGVLIFLVLHRALVFVWLYLLAGSFITSDLTYGQFLALDYFSLTITLMLGSWYGIWLGMYWFKAVYEENSHGGLVHHLATGTFFWNKAKNLQAKMSAAEDRLETDVWRLEDLANTALAQSQEPVKRKVVRKRTIRKV